MNLLGGNRFKGKLRDLKNAILNGTIDLDDDQDIDFIVDDSGKDLIQKKNPISSPSKKTELIDKLKMEKEKDPTRDDWKLDEMQKLPRGDNSFIDRFLKIAQSVGKKDQVDTWDHAHQFINSPEGKLIQAFTLMSMLSDNDEAKGMAMQVMGKGDTTNSKPSQDKSPQTLDPDKDIEKSSPLWFKRKIQSILKNNMQRRPAGGRLSGDLNFKRLYKIKSNARVFEKKEHISKKQYNLLLLIDCSSSMSGDRARVASICTSLLIRDFQDLVRLKVKTFNSRDLTVKEFNRRFKPNELKIPMNKIIKETNSDYSNANHDWFALRNAYNEIRKEKGEKMIITISDASPSSCYCGCNDKTHKFFPDNKSTQFGFLQTQNKEIHSRGDVKLMSVIVGHHHQNEDRNKDLYHQNYSGIAEYDQIYEAVTKVLSSAIKRK